MPFLSFHCKVLNLLPDYGCTNGKWLGSGSKKQDGQKVNPVLPITTLNSRILKNRFLILYFMLFILFATKILLFNKDMM
jgi:hypothetical protein